MAQASLLALKIAAFFRLKICSTFLSSIEKNAKFQTVCSLTEAGEKKSKYSRRNKSMEGAVPSGFGKFRRK